MTLKQSKDDYAKISRALRKVRFWSYNLHRYGETEEEKLALRGISNQLFGVESAFDKAMRAPMGRLLQEVL